MSIDDILADVDWGRVLIHKIECFDRSCQFNGCALMRWSLDSAPLVAHHLCPGETCCVFVCKGLHRLMKDAQSKLPFSGDRITLGDVYCALGRFALRISEDAFRDVAFFKTPNLSSDGPNPSKRARLQERAIVDEQTSSRHIEPPIKTPVEKAEFVLEQCIVECKKRIAIQSAKTPLAHELSNEDSEKVAKKKNEPAGQPETTNSSAMGVKDISAQKTKTEKFGASPQMPFLPPLSPIALNMFMTPQMAWMSSWAYHTLVAKGIMPGFSMSRPPTFLPNMLHPSLQRTSPFYFLSPNFSGSPLASTGSHLPATDTPRSQHEIQKNAPPPPLIPWLASPPSNDGESP